MVIPLSLFSLSIVSAAITGDLVASLPGYGKPPTPWYSGYLSIPGGKHMHYIFIESPNAQQDPVTAWFNGGPGCSSLEGLFAEMGQLWVDENDPSKLVFNAASWTNISSMLFTEAPACVGYSYADDISGCTHDDHSQAVDNYNALLTFFRGFSEYANNSFFITGESYAGIYVPTLAQQVVLGNDAGNPRVNLQGIAVGNGCLGLDIGVCAFDYRNELNTNMPFFSGHGLISPVTYAAVQKDCDPSAAGPSPSCQSDFDLAHSEIGNVNIYDIYGDCVYGATGGRKDASGNAVYSKAPVPMRAGSSGPVECIDETIAKYIGRADVATALNVIPGLHWAVCGSNSSFNYQRTERDERVDVYPTIWKAGVRVLIYNGEADACVPWIDNESWTRSLNFSIAKPWTSWESVGQVGGYVVQYTSPTGGAFDFATVKGAGHMVPQVKPDQAWTMFSRFVNAQPLA